MFLRPIQNYKEIIRKPAPTAEAPAADITVPPQIQAEPRRSARVTKRSQAVTNSKLACDHGPVR